MTTHRPPRDLFELSCYQLAGREIPPPPAIPGRVYTQRMDPKDDEDDDDFIAAWLARLEAREESQTWLTKRHY